MRQTTVFNELGDSVEFTGGADAGIALFPRQYSPRGILSQLGKISVRDNGGVEWMCNLRGSEDESIKRGCSREPDGSINERFDADGQVIERHSVLNGNRFVTFITYGQDGLESEERPVKNGKLGLIYHSTYEFDSYGN